MSNDNQPATIAELQAANRDLTKSLARCHELVADYRKALATKGERSFLMGVKRAAK